MLLEKIKRATAVAFDRLIEDSSHDMLQPWNESVFRYHIARSLIDDGVFVQSEWNDIDLVVSDSNQSTFVELKYYASPEKFGFKRQVVARKGGPSAKNFAEFRRSYNLVLERTGDSNLADKWGADIDFPLVVMVYLDRNGKSKTFGSYYDSVVADVVERLTQQSGDTRFTVVIYLPRVPL